LLSSNTSSTCPYNMVNFGPLTAETDWRVWVIPSYFNGYRVLAALLHGSQVVGVSHFAALNRGRHLRLAGRPSRWALAHILVLITFGRNVTGKVRNQKMLYFPPHLTSASTVPGDRGNAEIASFHLNVACYFASKRRKHTEIAPGHS